MSDFETTINEIVTQESNRCHLSDYKLMDSVNDIIFLLCNDFDIKQKWERKDPHPVFKSYLLDILYARHVLLRESPLFDNWFYRIYKDTLRRLHKRHKGVTIDDGLKPSPYTVAFKASRMLLSDIYTLDKDALLPNALEDGLHDACNACYPIALDCFIEQLKKEDRDFWEVAWWIITNSAQIAAYYHVEKRGGKLVIADKAKEESDLVGLVSDAVYRMIKKALSENKLSDITDSERLKKYINSVAINIIRNEQKSPKYSTINASLPNDELLDILQNKYGLPIADSFDTEEMKNIALEIIYKKDSKVYASLTKGLEKGLDVMHYRAKGLLYDDIVEVYYGKDLSPEEMKTKNSNLRAALIRSARSLYPRLELFYKRRES